MANRQHLEILSHGWQTWNDWRATNADIVPDLSGADLPDIKPPALDLIYKTLFRFHRFHGINFNNANLRAATFNGNLYGVDFGQADLTDAKLSGLNLNYSHFEAANLLRVDLRRARLHNANLSEADGTSALLEEADLEGADLSRMNLTGANLRGANLNRTRLVETNLSDSNINNCSVYGISAWDVKVEGTQQSNLIISPAATPMITVDSLEVAQFVYLLLNNERIRDVINTLGQKAVLIIGRFSLERRVVLEAIATDLRIRGFLPIIFDFEKSQERDFTETVMVLAGLALFVIADITNPKSSPLELHATVPNYMIPFVPLIKAGETPFSMFLDLQQKFDWVLDIVEYESLENLLHTLDRDVIEPALAKHNELIARKAARLRIKNY